MTLTELSIKRPILIIVFFSFIAVLGIFGFSQLKYDLMPKMSAPVITIMTIYPGASPNEVETNVTKLIEDAITGLDKVSAVRSSSYEGRSMVSVEFDQNADIDLSLQDAQRKVNAVQLNLPKDARQPVLSKIAFDELPILRMAVRANLDSKTLYQFVIDQIQPMLSKVSGVGTVTIIGGEQREIRINVDAQKLKGFGLSLPGVTSAIKTANMDYPTGNIYSDNDQFVVRVAAKYSSIKELSELVIGKSKSGSPIKLNEVADVFDGTKDLSTIYRLNGDNSIGLVIQKQNDANTVETSERVRKELKNMEKIFSSQNLKFDIAQDNSDFILDSANGVKFDLFLAILIVALVMLLFLHSIRNSMIVMVAIPSSLISVFFMMYIFDMSLNMMTLLAMSLVIGILVDDSIVVLENIYRHLEMGDNKIDASIKGRNEIGFAALSITLVDVVVFLPLAFIVGTIGSLLREYSLVVVFSTLMSLLVSFTITPMLSSRFSKLEHLSKKKLSGRISLLFESIFDKLTQYYVTTLRWGLKHGGMVVLATLALFVISFSLNMMGLIGFEFVPQSDRGELIVTVETSTGSKIENTNELTKRVERVISTIPDVKKVITNVGASSEGLLSMTSNNSTELLIKFNDKKDRAISTDFYGQKIKAMLADIPGVKVRVSPVSMMGTSSTPIQILVTGTDFDGVMNGAKTIVDLMRKVEGTTDVRLSSEESKPEIRVEIDREKLSELGLTIADVGSTMQIAFTGNDDSKFREGINEYDIRIMVDKFDRTNPDNVKNMTFMNSKGQTIYLNQFANISQSTGPTKLEREDRIRCINIFSQVYGKTSGKVAQDIVEKMKSVKLPEGVTFKLVGEQKRLGDSMTSLLMALTAGILFVYMIMVALYNSFLYPFVVLFSIPLAMVGAFFGLALTLKSISIFSMLGIIMLIGLVAKNAILLVDRTNQMRAEKNLSTYDALIEAGQTRLRPIIMTTLAMVFGMMPIALSSSSGSEYKSGLAVVLIGGLTSSLMLTLVLVPVVYQKLDKWKAALVKLKNKYSKKSKAD